MKYPHNDKTYLEALLANNDIVNGNTIRVIKKAISMTNDEGQLEPLVMPKIADLVDRFLRWELPENFNPDCGISFNPNFNEHTDFPMKHKPVGTNLFDAEQVKAMFEYLLNDSNFSA